MNLEKHVKVPILTPSTASYQVETSKSPMKNESLLSFGSEDSLASTSSFQKCNQGVPLTLLNCTLDLPNDISFVTPSTNEEQKQVSSSLKLRKV